MAVAPRMFVGRESELERLSALPAAARDGRSAVLCVLAPAGQGKTALLERLVGECGGTEVLRATGVEVESPVAFGALHAVLRPLLDNLPSLPDVQRDALAAALALGGAGRAEPFAVGAATLSLLAAGADRRPLVCVVDDLHWVDDASRHALLFAARRLRREPVGVALAAREGELAAAELRGFDVLRLGPLPDATAARLLAEHTGGRLPDETVRRLVAAADGNPLALLELTDRLTPEQRDGREVLVGPPPPDAGARALLGERVRRLPPAAREALLLAALAEDRDVAALTAAGARLDDLVAAEDARLLELHAGRVALRHPLVRSVAYHEATPRERRRAHAAIAAALAPGDGRRAWHLAAAAPGPDEGIARALDEEAERTRLRGGYASAARMRARAGDLTPDPPRRVERLLEAAQDHELAGRLEDAGRILGDALRLAVEPVALARIRGLQASLALRGGRPRDARDVLCAEAELLAAMRPRTAARFELQVAYASMALGDTDAWLAHARRGRDLVPPEDPGTAAVAESLHGAALIAAGREEEARPLVDAQVARLVAADLDEPIGGALEVHGALAEALAWTGRWDDAERVLERIEGDARRLSALASLPSVLVVRASCELALGRWTAAAGTIEEQLTLCADTGDLLHWDAGHAAHALLAAVRGDADVCRAAARRALDGARDSDVAVAARAQHALGLLALGRGDVERACEILDAIGARGHPEPGTRPWEPDRIEAHIRARDVVAAERGLAAWEADTARAGRAHALAAAARCRGLLVDDAEVDGTFAAALARHADVPLPFERARTLLCLGERLRRARRRADAREPLRDALGVFEGLGAADWAARARRELRAAGGAVPAAREPRLAALTPHEVQVARLVAEGRTNREVAAALFLAPKTIEHHLSAIFRKLDVKRRTELARLFAGEPASG